MAQEGDNQGKSSFAEGDMVKARWSDGYWYRARVNSVLSNSYCITYVEYGEENEVSHKDVAVDNGDYGWTKTPLAPIDQGPKLMKYGVLPETPEEAEARQEPIPREETTAEEVTLTEGETVEETKEETDVVAPSLNDLPSTLLESSVLEEDAAEVTEDSFLERVDSVSQLPLSLGVNSFLGPIEEEVDLGHCKRISMPSDPLPPLPPESTQRSTNLDRSGAPQEAMEGAGMRTRVAREIIETEKTYLQSLKFLEEQYVIALAQESEHETLPAAIHRELFSNVLTLKQLNERFFKDLELRVQEWDEKTTQIGDLFLDFAPFFKMYAAYVKDYTRAAQLLNTLLSERKYQRFQQFCQVRKSLSPQKLDLSSYLIMPVQRIPRYKLLLNEMLKHTEEDHPDYAHLQQSLEKVRETAEHINTRIMQFENEQRMVAICKMFGGRDLIKAGRRYITHGPLLKKGRKGTRDRRYEFFLFSDCIVYGSRSSKGLTLLKGKGLAKSAGSRVKFHRLIPLDSLFRLLDATVDSHEMHVSEERERTLVLLSSTKNFAVVADTSAEKQRWLMSVKAVVEEQNRKLETLKRKSQAIVPSQPVDLPDEAAGTLLCKRCKKVFEDRAALDGAVRCGLCGHIMCSNCSQGRILLENGEHRVCQTCFDGVRKRQLQGDPEANAVKLLKPQEDLEARRVASPATQLTMGRYARLSKLAGHNYRVPLSSIATLKPVEESPEETAAAPAAAAAPAMKRMGFPMMGGLMQDLKRVQTLRAVRGLTRKKVSGAAFTPLRKQRRELTQTLEKKEVEAVRKDVQKKKAHRKNVSSKLRSFRSISDETAYGTKCVHGQCSQPRLSSGVLCEKHAQEAYQRDTQKSVSPPPEATEVPQAVRAPALQKRRSGGNLRSRLAGAIGRLKSHTIAHNRGPPPLPKLPPHPALRRKPPPLPSAVVQQNCTVAAELPWFGWKTVEPRCDGGSRVIVYHQVEVKKELGPFAVGACCAKVALDLARAEVRIYEHEGDQPVRGRINLQLSFDKQTSSR